MIARVDGGRNDDGFRCKLAQATRYANRLATDPEAADADDDAEDLA